MVRKNGRRTITKRDVWRGLVDLVYSTTQKSDKHVRIEQFKTFDGVTLYRVLVSSNMTKLMTRANIQSADVVQALTQ